MPPLDVFLSSSAGRAVDGRGVRKGGQRASPRPGRGRVRTFALLLLLLGLADGLHLVLVRLRDKLLLVGELVALERALALEHLLLGPDLVELARRGRRDRLVHVLGLRGGQARDKARVSP